jgi:tRNA(Ile)-lysidine synthase
MKIDETLARALTTSYDSIGSPKRLMLALSGGADSVALFHLLCRMAAQRSAELRCVHVHHGLRASAEGEADFVSSLCRQSGLPLTIKRVKVESTGSLEASARKARYNAFHEAMQETGIDIIALAHHADDQAETVVMHLMHGAGPSGLAGMREFDRGIWRPLLTTPKSVLIKLLEDNDLTWCEDESNQHHRHFRNAIRHSVMPILQAFTPACSMNIVRTAQILRDEEDYWQSYVAQWLKLYACLEGPHTFLMTKPCSDLPLAAKRRVFRGLCAAIGIELDFLQTQRLCDLLGGAPGSMLNLPSRVQALRTRERLFLLKQPTGQLRLGQLTQVNDASQIDDSQQVLDADKLQGAVLRYRQAGDWLSPLGAGGSQKLRKYMIDRQIDRPLRDSWPLLCRGKEVLWVIGVGIAQTVSVNADTRMRAVMRYEGRLPGELTIHHQGEEHYAREFEPIS